MLIKMDIKPIKKPVRNRNIAMNDLKSLLFMIIVDYILQKKSLTTRGAYDLIIRADEGSSLRDSFTKKIGLNYDCDIVRTKRGKKNEWICRGI